MDHAIDARVGERTAEWKWQEEDGRQEMFNCPCCGKQTTYDPFRLRAGGKEKITMACMPYWYLYVLVESQHCLHEEMVFWMRARLNLPVRGARLVPASDADALRRPPLTLRGSDKTSPAR